MIMKKIVFGITILLVIFGLIFGKRIFKQNLEVQAQTLVISWAMAGGNPQRTSWVQEQVPSAAQLTANGGNGKLNPDFYIPVEPYIPHRVQIVGGDNQIFLSTARGLYAFDASTGSLAGTLKWVYATEMPLGHSPTYYETSFLTHSKRLYVGGLDHKIHAIDADTGQGIWTYEAKLDGIGAGFETNPLVLNIGGTIYIYAGNRDGYMYALKESSDGTSSSLVWSFKTDGPILFSAAASSVNSSGGFDSNTKIYFASNDSYAYSLNATSGNLVWKSGKLPGQGFSAYWPVVYKDSSTQKEYVMLPGASNYRANVPPGINVDVMSVLQILDREIWQGVGNYGLTGGVDGTLIGVKQPNGQIDTSQKNSSMAYSLSSYFNTKPQRRTAFVLDATSGQEVVPYAPFTWNGTGGANRYPAIVMPDNNVYQSGALFYRGNVNTNINAAGILSWKPGSTLVGTPESTILIVDEPVYYSGGGNIVYNSWHTDLEVDAFDISKPNNYPTKDGSREWEYYGQGQNKLSTIFPNYDTAMDGYGGDTGTGGWYSGNWGAFGVNGSYGRDGYGNPPVPYNGRVYLHQGNAIVAFSTINQSVGIKKPTARISTTNMVGFNPTVDVSILKQRLSDQIQSMISAGHLRPGYYSSGNNDGPDNAKVCGADFYDYFHNPGDTFWALSSAVNDLSSTLTSSVVLNYLSSEYSSYNPATLAHVGWKNGASREAFILPSEIDASRSSYGSSNYYGDYEFHGWYARQGNNNTSVPPYNFYALWKYAVAKGLTGSAAAALLNGGISQTVPPDSFLIQYPFVVNAYLSGFYGYMKIQQLAGQTVDSTINSKYQTLLAFRIANFTKDNGEPYSDTTCASFNTARNFMFLAPEVLSLLNASVGSKISDAVTEYNRITPYWFVSGFDDAINEGGHQPLYNSILLQVKKNAFNQSREELLKYLDVPWFKTGDLFYIQNLVAVIEAQSSSSCGPKGDIDCSGHVNATDLAIFLSDFGGSNLRSDLDGSGKVNVLDLAILLGNFGR
jgi:outer membrane protein assembly factor BamB